MGQIEWYDWLESKKVRERHYPFDALLAALFAQADSSQLEKLRLAFPGVWKELCARDAANMGVLPDDGFSASDARRWLGK